MGFILYLLAFVLRFPLFAIGFLYGAFKSFYKKKFKQGLKNMDNKFFTLAQIIDQNGNFVCAELFNDTLIQKNSLVKFGDFEITISEVLGHNYVNGTLTRAGTYLVWFLDFVDRNHVLKAAGYIKKHLSFMHQKCRNIFAAR